MGNPLLLNLHDLSPAHPFAHPWHISADRAYLQEMFVDLHSQIVEHGAKPQQLATHPQLTSTRAREEQKAEQKEDHCLYYPDGQQCHKRLMLLDIDYLRCGEALTVIGFFGTKRRNLLDEIVAEIQRADGQLTAQFGVHPDIVCYYTMLLADGYNHVNLVLLKRLEGIQAWNNDLLHQHAARMLSPLYYDTVRIYHGTIPADSGLCTRLLELRQVKYWDFQTTPIWHAVRKLTAEPAQA